MRGDIKTRMTKQSVKNYKYDLNTFKLLNFLKKLSLCAFI